MARIDTLTFAFGPGRGNPPETINVPNVLLFVGPNESGKSLATVTIQEWYDGSHDKIDPRIYSSASFKIFNQSEAQTYLEPLRAVELSDYEFPIWTGDSSGKITDDRTLTLQDFCDGAAFTQKNWRSYHLGRLRIMPTLSSSLSIMNDVEARPVKAGARYESLHQLLLSDRSRLDKVNRLVHAATGYYVAVQLLETGRFRIQLNPEAPPSEIPGMILSNSLQDYYKQGIKIQSFGDGFKAFIGMVLSVFPFEHKLVLLDEPELHLHPPLANRLAQELVAEMDRRNGQLIVATHSPDFLAGCINATNSVCMARLTHSKISASSTAKAVSKDKLEPFINNKVVRNTDAIAGIFHESAIVVEGVFDKIAYSEFNRCLQLHRNQGIRDPHFVSAGSCAQVLNVAHVMRETGTPTAAILDLDVLYSDSIAWHKDELNRLGIPPSDQPEVHSLIDYAKQELRKRVGGLSDDGKRRVKLEGTSLLDGPVLQTVED